MSFSQIIKRFRPKDEDIHLTIHLDTELSDEYELCLSFAEDYSHLEDAEIYALQDILHFGENDAGILNQRLVQKLSHACVAFRGANPLY